MPPAKLDLEIYRGDDYVHQLNFTDDSTPPNSFNISDYVFKAQIRDRPENGTVIYAEFNIDVTQAIDGILVLSLPAESTQIPNGFWDLQVDLGSITQTWLKGDVKMTGDVTREVVI